MKKIISILLLVCTLTLCLASCGGSNDNSSNDNSNNDNNNNDNTPTCETTDLHTYENGECTGCGLKVFDVLKNYLIENAEPNYYNEYKISFGAYGTDQYYSFITYSEKNNSISIACYVETSPTLSSNYKHVYNIGLTFTPYTFEDGGYEWAAGCTKLSCDCPTIRGRLDPTKFSRSTTSLEYTPNESKSDTVEWKARTALKENIDKYFIDFLNNIGNNMSMDALGFVRYE